MTFRVYGSDYPKSLNISAIINAYFSDYLNINAFVNGAMTGMVQF
jgi:hypothetical protein